MRHFPFISRELVLGLMDMTNVSVTKWLNARHVPPCEGEFGFDENIESVIWSIQRLGPSVHILALCQGVVPALAAAAILARRAPPR